MGVPRGQGRYGQLWAKHSQTGHTGVGMVCRVSRECREPSEQAPGPTAGSVGGLPVVLSSSRLEGSVGRNLLQSNHQPNHPDPSLFFHHPSSAQQLAVLVDHVRCCTSQQSPRVLCCMPSLWTSISISTQEIGHDNCTLCPIPQSEVELLRSLSKTVRYPRCDYQDSSHLQSDKRPENLA